MGKLPSIMQVAISSLMKNSFAQNEEYHRTIRDLVSWLEKTEADIQNAEPIDLTVGTKQLRAQLTKFQVRKSFLWSFKMILFTLATLSLSGFARSIEPI